MTTRTGNDESLTAMLILGIGAVIAIVTLIAAGYFLIFEGDSTASTAEELPVLTGPEAAEAINAGRVVRFNLDESEAGGEPLVVLYFNDGTPPHRLSGYPPSQDQNFLAWLQENGASITSISTIQTTFDEWE